MRKRLKTFAAILAMAVSASCMMPALAEDSAAVTVEFEDFLSEEGNSDFRLQNEMVSVSNKTKDTCSYTVSFMLEDEGDYTMELLAAAHSGEERTKLLSPLSLALDEDVVLTLDGDFSSETYDTTGKGYIRSTFTSKELIHMEAGTHTLVITGSKVDGYVYFALDSMKISKYVEPEPEGIIVRGDTQIEAEDVLSSGITADASASEGKLYIIHGGTEEVALEIPFYVAEPGEYNLNIAAACSGNGNTYISPLQYQIDGEEPATVDKSVGYLESNTPLEGWYTNDFSMYLFRCGSAVYYEKGYHKITLYVKERSAGGTYAAFDYLQLRKEKDLSNLTMAIEEGFLRIGESKEVKLLDANGEIVKKEDFFAPVRFSVTQGESITADDKELRAVAYGKSTVMANLKYDGEEYCATADFYVTDRNGLVLDNVIRVGNQVTVSVSAMTDYTAEDYLMIYTYPQTNGMLHSIKNFYRIDLENMTAGETKEVTQEIESASSDKICVLLFNGASDKISTYRQMIAE